MNGVTTSREWQMALTHLRDVDPVMGGIIERVGEVDFQPGGDLYEKLVGSVISQLISTAAADTVKKRLYARTDNTVTPHVLAQLSQEEFRAVGIGAQKYRHLSAMTQRFLEAPDDYAQVHTLDDGAVLRLLTDLPGIGKWTAQMVLIFCLGRQDVFAPDDFGLRNAMLRHYEWDGEPKRKDLERKAEVWAPYRSVASVYLWNSLGKW